MYNFIDTTESWEGALLPSEALKINGEYIEELIPGYRTLSVKGREAHSTELSTYYIGIRDGSILKGRRLPERTITVKFQLMAESNEDYREAFNKLGGILNVQEAQLIFEDEPDKYFIGTPSGISNIEPGRNSVTGEFGILCADPLKYSLIEYEAEPSVEDSSILIDYKGTHTSYPTLEVDFYEETEGDTELTGHGDCGYVAFFNESEKIIQLGDPDEIDGTILETKSQTLINQTFNASGSWGTSAQGLWSANSGVTIGDISQGGSLGMAVASYEQKAVSPAATSATIIKALSTADVPHVNYTVVAKSSGRTASSVKLTFAITASLALDRNYFGRGYVLDASVYVGGKWYTVRLKNSTDYWRGRTGHTVNLNVTISGLSDTSTALSGIKFKVARNDAYISEGPAGVLSEQACSNIPISAYAASVAETYFLAPSGYGTADGWHGPTISRTIEGSDNFTLSFKNKVAATMNQMGGFQAVVSASDGTVLAGVSMRKNEAGKYAAVSFWANGEKLNAMAFDVSNFNETTTIIKSGARITFKVGSYSKEFEIEAIRSTKATKLTIAFEQYGTSEKIASNGIYWVKFNKDNCDVFNNIPNKFSANDVLIADCKNGEIYLNDVLTPSLGALGNDWEEFYLSPGLNQIGISFSDWVPAEYAPKIKIRYREAFL